MGQAIIVVLVSHGRDAAIRRMEMLRSMAELEGFYVLEEVVQSEPIRCEQISVLCAADTLYLDGIGTLGRTQRECVRALDRLRVAGVRHVYVLCAGGDLVEVDGRVLDLLREFGRMDVELMGGRDGVRRSRPALTG